MDRRDFLAATASTALLARLPAAASAAAFPRRFLWGASTSAYQIEGSIAADGKGESVWDQFVRRPGVIADGQSGQLACDFYRRYPGDIALMRALGLRAFRFSVAWTRVLPAGRGAVNQAGLDFYRGLVDALLAAGIEPVPTLFHWDTPLVLQRQGGWQTRAMADWFADYAAIVAGALGDRVRWWLTINEPRSFIGGGYVAGVQAPGLRLPRREALAAAHIALLAHGRAVQAIRAHASRPVQVGLPNDISPVLPHDSLPAAAAYEATFTTQASNFTTLGEAGATGPPASPSVSGSRGGATRGPAPVNAARWWNENAWWHDPVYRGAYPAAALASLGPDAPIIAPGDMATIHQPLDFIAANVYGGQLPEPLPPGFPRTASGWPVTPEALEWAPRWLHQRYHLPVFITENGCSTRDWVSLDGQVHDPQRQDFTARYLQSLNRAAAAGTPILGYLHWSLLDNFEWQDGFTQRFGLVYVDFSTQRRILKDSARWYARHIAAAISTRGPGWGLGDPGPAERQAGRSAKPSGVPRQSMPAPKASPSPWVDSTLDRY